MTIEIIDNRPSGYLTTAEFSLKSGVKSGALREAASRNQIPGVLKIGFGNNTTIWFPENLEWHERKRGRKRKEDKNDT